MSQITAKAKASWTLLNLREAKHWASYRLTLSAKAPGICLWHKNSPWRFVSTNTISFSSGGESRGGLCAAARPSQQHGYTGSVRTGLVDDSDTIKYERRAEKGCRRGQKGGGRIIRGRAGRLEVENKAYSEEGRGVEQLVPRGGLHEVPDPVCRGLELPLQVVPLQPVLPPAAVKLIQTQVRVRVRPGPPERLSGVGPGRVGTGARGERSPLCGLSFLTALSTPSPPEVPPPLPPPTRSADATTHALWLHAQSPQTCPGRDGAKSLREKREPPLNRTTCSQRETAIPP
ncbi:hypothetical protein F7725_027264 [Dissostichus mawsoni]|uniref:Uncharacterized protein n=1 Tax=Dissostichus mawsoni TaxID=36200 RepID=A0A7J5XCE8_DISMA|nr:hypothetical protein F7725_027264 [Dissostichus mawsoni]